MRILLVSLHLLASMVSSTLSYTLPSTASSSLRAMQEILSKARRLEDNGAENQAGAQMEAFLMDYSMKLMTCIPDQILTDADYNDHFGVVIFRLCPSNHCSDDNGCSSGYADFAIDVGTYVEAFMKDQQDNMNWDDKFDGGKFGQCTEYEDDDNGATGYYIGPGCTADGSGVRMAVFEDKYCYQMSQTSFETISNGWGLPFSDGGLVSTKCTSCIDNDGALRDMCLDLYELAPYGCEQDFDFDHYYYDTNFEMYRYGKDQTGCTKIAVMQASKPAMKGAVWQDLIISVMLLITAAGGFALYSVWWRKQKENLEKIEDEDEDDDSAYHQHGDDHDDGELVQHPHEGYQGMEDANGQGTLA
ncbi:hypothetical protein IV203_010193 [Nitzschia inconspicua]|uniref:Uncharacterized protein n=1 Tax=Nitzschia inconspicua TaxID=303405 RepID=A0A9K3PKP5_9STRA|nr:hypothetical protein IV203_010193 [Nitzschia inconspicua]